jgi:hypothetical protein
MTKTGSFLSILKMVLPMVITTINPRLAPIVGEIQDGMVEAEGIKNASGKDKLAHVQNLAKDAADSVNIAKGQVIINPDEVHSAVDDVASTTIAITNMLHRKMAPSSQVARLDSIAIVQ